MNKKIIALYIIILLCSTGVSEAAFWATYGFGTKVEGEVRGSVVFYGDTTWPTTDPSMMGGSWKVTITNVKNITYQNQVIPTRNLTIEPVDGQPYNHFIVHDMHNKSSAIGYKNFSKMYTVSTADLIIFEYDITHEEVTEDFTDGEFDLYNAKVTFDGGSLQKNSQFWDPIWINGHGKMHLVMKAGAGGFGELNPGYGEADYLTLSGRLIIDDFWGTVVSNGILYSGTRVEINAENIIISTLEEPVIGDRHGLIGYSHEPRNWKVDITFERGSLSGSGVPYCVIGLISGFIEIGRAHV
jgi:hypothetical protein